MAAGVLREPSNVFCFLCGEWVEGKLNYILGILNITLHIKLGVIHESL